MGCCSGRCFLVTFCIFQIVLTAERQIFDFLGYMWAPIIGNFLQIIFVIIGLFGAYQYRPKFLVVYAVWCSLWLGWNIFIICLYLEVGILRRDSPILSIGTNNRSWWLDQKITCQWNNTGGSYYTSTAEEGCVEIIHAGVQCIMALIGFVISCYVIYVFTEEDDSSPATPVNDIEFIKMRYKTSARSSFRDVRKMNTLNRSNYNTQQIMTQIDNVPNTPGSRYSASDTHSEYSRSINNIRTHPKSNHDQNSLRNSKKSRKKDKNHTGELPWVRVSPTPNKGTNHHGDFDDLPDTSMSAPSEYRENSGYDATMDRHAPDDYGPYPYTFDSRPRPAVMV